MNKKLINAGDWSGLSLTSTMDELDKIIAERTVQYNYEGWTKLHHACDIGSLEYMKIIIADPGVNVNARTAFKYTPLKMLCHHTSSTDSIKLLLDAGADVNIPDDTGWTPLHALCGRGGLVECIKLIIAADADVNALSIALWAPLHVACYLNDMPVVQTLLEAGADASIKTSDGQLPWDLTKSIRIKDLLEGLGGGRSLKAAQ